MRVPDKKLAEVWDRGFTVVEGFLDADTLAAAREALWGVYPRPEDYFADPEKYPELADSQFSGITVFPYADWALNRIPVCPDAQRTSGENPRTPSRKRASRPRIPSLISRATKRRVEDSWLVSS